jgi:branched-chain amino acid aminotransferase
VHRFVLHNEEIREATDLVLAPGQVGLLCGWGVFSTIRVTGGVLFAWDRHWARMQRDAALLHVPFPDDSKQVQRRLLELVEANQAPEATLRVCVVRNRGGMWEGPDQVRPADLIAMLALSKEWGESVSLSYAANARHAASRFAGAKILSWAMNLTLLEEAQSRGFDEVILLNERGEVAECTSANIFAANGSQVRTPPLNSGCLPGITRELLLSEVRAANFSVIEAPLFPSDLEQADAVFITSTTRNLLPVREIEGRPIARRGSACEALSSAFADFVSAYVAEHRKYLLSKA